MKFRAVPLVSWIRSIAAASLVLFAATACNKSDSSPGHATASAEKQRLKWNIQTLVDAYEHAGHTNPKWDQPAIRALTEFARMRSGATETNESPPDIIASSSTSCVEAGCDDPMILYLSARFPFDKTANATESSDAFVKAALAMRQSSYPAIRKFYASLRAVQQVYSAYGTNADRQTIHDVGGQVVDYLMEALSDKKMPVIEAYEAASEGLEVYRGSKTQYEDEYHKIEKPLLENWPNEPVVLLFKGSAYIRLAWNARGGGYADSVSPEGWKLFADRLDVAGMALTRAWELDPKDTRIAVQMMSVELGQGQGRDRMELWFNRAMELDPDDYDACNSKLYYLEPKWHGSAGDMLAFGRECVNSKTWGGHVPLILIDAHDAASKYLDESERAGYWKRPEVWPDLQAAFEKFFQLNPDATGWYHNYAWYAYHCEQWDKLNELLPRLEPVNYEYFGGREEFDKMVKRAKEHASSVDKAK